MVGWEFKRSHSPDAAVVMAMTCLDRWMIDRLRAVRGELDWRARTEQRGLCR